jgi:hypothetical protein
MVAPPLKRPFFHRRAVLIALFSLTFPFLVSIAASAHADSDVYAVLPEDTRVIQYGLGDLDGDSREELAVLFSSGSGIHLSLFKARSGHWSSWGTVAGPPIGMDGAEARSMELLDTNGNGKDEILLYYLTPGKGAMAARILTIQTSEGGLPVLDLLLEDRTSPPGYPLFGFTDGSPSVTFLKMPAYNGDDGFRRVYCWGGDRFKKCLEIPWENP